MNTFFGAPRPPGSPRSPRQTRSKGVKKPSPQKKSPKKKGIQIESGENRRDLNAPYTVVYPNPEQPLNDRYSRVYKKHFGDTRLLTHPGSGLDNGLVWYYYDPYPDGTPWEPLSATHVPSIGGNHVDMVNDTFSLSGDPRQSTNNPYLYVAVKKNTPLRTSELSPGRFQETKLDVVSVVGPDGKQSVVKYASANPTYFFTLHKNLQTGGFDKWYGRFAYYTPTPPNSPQRSQFGKRRKGGKGVKSGKSLTSLRRDLKQLLKM